MEQVAPEQLLVSPIGKWATTHSSLVWCHSPALGGAVAWGRPTLEDAMATMRLLEVYLHPAIARRFAIAIDCHAVQAVDWTTVDFLIEWIRRHLPELRERVTLQVGIAPGGMTGVVLSSLLAVNGPSHPVRVCADWRAALFELAPSFGEALHGELRAALELARAVAPELRGVRELLQACDGRMSLHEAARRLGLSARSLQRALASAGASFRDEQLAARFSAARTLLAESELKVAAIAARLGISQRALAQLFTTRGAPPPRAYRLERRARRSSP
jgi:AraC-like DNA-binding protein